MNIVTKRGICSEIVCEKRNTNATSSFPAVAANFYNALLVGKEISVPIHLPDGEGFSVETIIVLVDD